MASTSKNLENDLVKDQDAKCKIKTSIASNMEEKPEATKLKPKVVQGIIKPYASTSENPNNDVRRPSVSFSVLRDMFEKKMLGKYIYIFFNLHTY